MPVPSERVRLHRYRGYIILQGGFYSIAGLAGIDYQIPIASQLSFRNETSTDDVFFRRRGLGKGSAAIDAGGIIQLGDGVARRFLQDSSDFSVDLLVTHYILDREADSDGMLGDRQGLLRSKVTD